ncbi:MAG TPA: Flp pilus assembly protein CpaB [Vicinamibacterales bacterium]|jgi:pilus assembly protein CpaB
MNRKTRTMIVVAVAVATAAVASASVYRAVGRIPVREVEVAHQYVVLAAHPIALGASLTASDLKRVGWPSSSPLPGAFSSIDEVVGRGVVTAVNENEPITESKLASRDAGAGLSPAIPPGMRAISVKVNEVIGVAGFATPGARVDVLVTVRRSDDAVTRVLVPNVRVLTAGTRYDQEQSRDVKPIPSTVVTLMVTPSQAEKIALASYEGQITLMLRNPIDVAEPVTPGAHLARLVDDVGDQPVSSVRSTSVTPRHVQPPAPLQAEAPAAKSAPAPGYTVEAIRAGKRTQETVR